MADPSTHSGVLLPYLTPTRAARGPWRIIGLGQSFAIHLLGLIILLLGLSFLGEIYLDDLVYEVQSDAPMFAAGALAYFVALQFLYLLAAVLTTCLGAGCEPWGQAYRRTLSRWYQLTPWHVLLTLALIGVMLGVESLEEAYYYDFYREGVHRMLEAERAQFLFTAARHLSGCIYGLVLLWMTLATLVVHREQPTWHARCRWPAICEMCGYLLLGLAEDQGCPECGKPVHESKHADRAPIQGRYWSITKRVLRTPSQVGAHLLTHRPTHAHYRVLTIAILYLVLTGPISAGLIDFFDYGMPWSYNRTALDYLELYLLDGLLLGVGFAGFFTAICLAAGSLQALSQRLFAKRDVLPAAAQACCLSAGLLPIWALLVSTSIIGLIRIDNQLNILGIYLDEIILTLGWLLFHAGLFILYFLHLGRIIRAARYANV